MLLYKFCYHIKSERINFDHIKSVSKKNYHENFVPYKKLVTYPLEQWWSTTDYPFHENRGFENPKSSENGILVVQHGSGASNARLKIVESLKLKLRGSFLRFS